MIVFALLLFGAVHSHKVDKTSLQYYQQTFVIRKADTVLRIPLSQPKPKPPLFVAFRKDDSYAVWDDRGLTVRHGKKAISSRLPDISVSGKIFSAEEVHKTVSRIHAGVRTKDSSGLSGCRRIGSDVYFLVRWDEKGGKAWAEALVRVDLSLKKPTPRLLGKFDGLSTADKPIDDKLLIVHGKPAIVCHDEDTWGLATYDPTTKSFSTQNLGAKLVSYQAINAIQALFTEKSSYGTMIAGRVDLETGTRKILYEGHENVRFLDYSSPEIVLAVDLGETKIVNCMTGIERTIPFVLDGRRAGKDVLFWNPSTNPKAAWLLGVKTWDPVARWRSGKS